MSDKNTFLNAVTGPLLKAALTALSWTRLPQTRGRLRVDGLTAHAEILRDRWGVPHIYAQTNTDVLFAQGFVHAQERLWQMDFTRRVVAGRLAEVLGEGALVFDRGMRTLGLRRVAAQEADQIDGPFRPLIEAYCAGANAWIESACRRRKLPVEFTLLGYNPEPWQPVDCTSWAKLMCWDLAANWQSELLRSKLIQRIGPEKTAQLETDLERAWAVILDAQGPLTLSDPTQPFGRAGAADGLGSNNWVVHGSRSASGKPLLANDMHLGLSVPAIWYENHLSGGDLEVTGISLPGVPLVIAGHNRSLAWGFTDGMADVQDLYEEHLRPNPAGGWEYEYRGEWLPAELRREEIRIKGGKTTIEEVILTHHGPIINPLFKDAYPDTPPLALRWTSLEPEALVPAFYEMNTAADCHEFHQALRGFSSPVQNTVYADTQGNIAYTLPGKIPIRPRGDGSLPVPGWTGEDEWIGWIPFDELPQLWNPARGFVATANNPVTRDRTGHLVSRDFITCDRAARITELLEANPRLDPAYCQKMHFDQVSWSARAVGKALGRLKISEPELRTIVQRFQTWDGDLRSDSALTLVYQAVIRQAIRLLLEHALGDLGERVQGNGPTGFWGDHAWEWFVQLLDQPDSAWFDLGGGEGRDDVLHKALRLAVDQLKTTEGPDPTRWQWGRRHRLVFGHILAGQKPLDQVFNLGPFPLGGDGSTIWATVTHLYDLEVSRVVGPPFRFIADLADLDHCLGLLAPGQSGHLASRHYRDGVKPWFEGGYHPMLFRREEVEQNLEGKLVLE